MNRTLKFVLAALCLLLVPFFAMQFQVSGWDWGMTDFAIVVVFLVSAGIALAELTNSEFPRSRRLMGVGALIFILLLFVHMAVGIVDSWPLAGS